MFGFEGPRRHTTTAGGHIPSGDRLVRDNSRGKGQKKLTIWNTRTLKANISSEGKIVSLMA